MEHTNTTTYSRPPDESESIGAGRILEVLFSFPAGERVSPDYEGQSRIYFEKGEDGLLLLVDSPLPTGIGYLRQLPD
jgi:hypothetical protein